MGPTTTPPSRRPARSPRSAVEPRHVGVAEVGDGRTLGWAEWGHPDGDPVLWFHGTPGARLQLHPEVGAIALNRGFRVIGVERPGTGRSTDHRYRRVTDFAVDVDRLADELGLEHFGVVGLSGGGPYTLACAHDLPDRVRVAVTLGGLGPTTGPDAVLSFTRLLSLYAPLLEVARVPVGGLLRSVVGLAGRSAPLTHGIYNIYAKGLSFADRPVLEDPEFRRMFVGDLIGAGALGAVGHDLALFAREWGFRLADIRVPVVVVQGLDDRIVPISHGNHLAARIPTATFIGRPGEGHFAGFSDVELVLTQIRQAWTVSPLTF